MQNKKKYKTFFCILVVFKSGSEKAKFYRDLKKTKERERQIKKYHQNKDVYNENKRKKRHENDVIIKKVSENTKRQRLYRQKLLENKKQSEAKRIERNRKKREYRNKLKSNQNNLIVETDFEKSFQSRTQKHRALKKMKENLPTTPRKRAALLSSYLNSKGSPTVNIMQKMNKVPSPEDIKNVELAEAVMSDIKTIVSDTKLKRTNDARATLNIVSAAVNGKNVQTTKCRIQLSKKLGFNARRMSSGM